MFRRARDAYIGQRYSLPIRTRHPYSDSIRSEAARVRLLKVVEVLPDRGFPGATPVGANVQSLHCSIRIHDLHGETDRLL